MKKEELFKLAEEFKVDDEYIEEALTGNSGDRGIKVYAGKTKPIKIIAPIAACLAVFTAAGIVFANRDKLPINNTSLSPASSGESLSDEEKLEQVFEDFKDRDKYADIVNSVTDTDNEGKTIVYPHIIPIWQDPAFAQNCMDHFLDKNPQISMDNVTRWYDDYIDIDFDGSAEYLLCVEVDHVPAEVCVFRRVGIYSEAEYLGSFGSAFPEKYFGDLYCVSDIVNKCYYYFDNTEEYEKCTDSIRKVFFDKNTNSIQDITYLQSVKTYPNDASSDTLYTETAYRYGEEISIDQLLNEWDSLQGSADELEILPVPNVSGAHNGTDGCVQMLVDKYGLSTSANSLHRVVRYLDVDQDGNDETLIEFRDCEQLKGIYVFTSEGKLIGELDTEGYRGQNWRMGGDLAEIRVNYNIFRYEENGETYYCYLSWHSGSDTYSTWLEEEIYRIVVNADGTLGAVAVIECSYEGDDWFRINGKEVSKEEFADEMDKYEKYLYPKLDAAPFVW